MSKGITHAAIKNKKMTILMIVLTLIVGLYSYYVLPRQESPDISAPVARITTVYPGAAPEDVEELVSKVIEDEVANVEGVDYVRSTSKSGLSTVIVYLKDGADPDESWDDLREKIQPVQGKLPSECRPIDINTNLVDTAGIIISMTGEGYSYQELASYADNFKKELSKIDGVKRFEINGELDKEISVEVDIDKLNHYGLSLDDIGNIIQSQNISIPSGDVDNGKSKISVQSNGTYESIDEIRNTILMSSGDGNILRLKDIASVEYEIDDSSPRFKQDGKDAVLLTGYFEETLNVVLVGNEVEDKIEELKGSLPGDIEFNEVIFQPKDVEKSINDFIINLIESIVFVILVVFFGMGGRNAIIVSTAIPLSICMSFVIMYFTGIKLEQMSISALIIALGMLVDNAIVVSDSIQGYIDDGLAKFEACVKGTKDVAMSMLTSTLTTVLAFAPLLFIGSAVGEYIFGVPSVVIIALMNSYVCAMITTPTLAYIFFKKSKKKAQKESKLRNFFDKLLKTAMKRKVAMIICAVIGFVSMGVALKGLEVSMFPKADKDLIYINITSENSSDLSLTEDIADNVVALMAEEPEVIETASGIGDSLPKFYMTVRSSSKSNDLAQVLLKIDLKESTRFKNRSELLVYLQDKLDKNIVGGKTKANLLDAGSGGDSPINIRLYSDSIEDLQIATDMLTEAIAGVEGTMNIDDDFASKEYQFKVNVDMDKASIYGISKYDVQGEVSRALRGKNSSTFRKNGNEYDIIVKSDITTKEDLENLAIKSSITGKKVLLKEVAEVSLEAQYPLIRRYDRERTSTITSDLKNGYTAGNVEKEIKKIVKDLDIPSNVRLDFDGEASSITDSFSDLGILSILSLLLIICVLVFQFNSYMQPIVILSTIPLATIGAVWSLFLTRQPLSFTAMLGLVSLLGIVVNNAIVLIDYINSERESGKSIDEACSSAVDRRFRPIMLSTTTTVIGLVPLVLAGGEMFRPMAIALMGGLSISTILTLVVVPTIYSMVENKMMKRKKKEKVA
ncbi:efflux RND transporter permease subunit [Anaeromicrobium sediminis]|uniref:Transporter n=1 Tax=Anaeromicrobium sediminis TaxID=1478221 RepID=A0A267MLM5_9FIRM|nr:efflux RND transporter permease subunit [Anaeromicrobium sediminis]PAB60489.1 hypothetical protein CCE28_06215 [Anaeromicrobium sediminis]